MNWYIGNDTAYAVIEVDTREEALAVANDGNFEATEIREATQEEIDEYFME